MNNAQNIALQTMCRYYLTKLKGIASKYGIDWFVDDLIEKNKRKECQGTEQEVALLARAVDDERIKRIDVPKILDKSYRKCVEDEDFEQIETLPKLGIYSKISAILHKVELDSNGLCEKPTK